MRDRISHSRSTLPFPRSLGEEAVLAKRCLPFDVVSAGAEPPHSLRRDAGAGEEEAGSLESAGSRRNAYRGMPETRLRFDRGGAAFNARLAEVTFLVDHEEMSEIANSLLRRTKGGAALFLRGESKGDRRARGPRDDRVVAVANNLIFHQHG